MSSKKVIEFKKKHRSDITINNHLNICFNHINEIELWKYNFENMVQEFSSFGPAENIDLEFALLWIEKIMDRAKKSPEISDQEYLELMKISRNYYFNPVPRIKPV